MMGTMTDARADAERDVATHVTALHQAAKSGVTDFARKLHPELHPLGYAVLRLAFEAPEGVRSGDVAAALGADKSSVSRQVAFLREIEFIATRPDPLDGRASLLLATDEARDRITALRVSARGDYERVFTEWETADIERLAALLGRFVASVSGTKPVERVQ